MPTDGHEDDLEKAGTQVSPGAASGGLGNAAVEDTAQVQDPVIDDWGPAFEALEKQAATPAAGDEADAAGDAAAAAAAAGDDDPSGDALVDAGGNGGSVSDPGGTGGADGGRTPEDISALVAQYSTEIEQRAARETAQAFLNRTDDQGRKLIRQTNGVLGATINDPDIYRVDPETGVASFFNPDTGKPFDGPNPRAQAKQWVADWNEDLQETFNRIALARKAELEAEMAPVIQLLEFTPTYDALDPVRQKMFDALVEDYEVYDSENNHIGYSCDLNEALARVNRQVAALQAGREQPTAPAAPAAPSSPAVDMPNVGGGGGLDKPITSLAEAMEAAQDKLLARSKGGK